MQCLHIKQPQVLSFDPFKADVFAIGMIVLSCCSLTQPNTYYNYETFELDMKNIVIVIKEISQKYHSPLLDEVLGMMLTEKD